MLIFISYRRRDVPDAAGRLADALQTKFGVHRVFIDVSDISPGVNFQSRLASTLAEATAMIVVIGPSWCRLATWDKDDFVLYELETAFQRKLLIIPVLAGNANMPSQRQLPGSLAALSLLNACDISAPGAFGHAISQLTQRLASIMISREDFTWGIKAILERYRAEKGLTLAPGATRAFIYASNLAHLPTNPGRILALAEFFPGLIKGAQAVALFGNDGIYFGGRRPGGDKIRGFIRYSAFPTTLFKTEFHYVPGSNGVADETIDLGNVQLVVSYMSPRLGSRGMPLKRFVEMLDDIKAFVASAGAPAESRQDR